MQMHKSSVLVRKLRCAKCLCQRLVSSAVMPKCCLGSAKHCRGSPPGSSFFPCDFQNASCALSCNRAALCMHGAVEVNHGQCALRYAPQHNMQCCFHTVVPRMLVAMNSPPHLLSPVLNNSSGKYSGCSVITVDSGCRVRALFFTPSSFSSGNSVSSQQTMSCTNPWTALAPLGCKALVSPLLCFGVSKKKGDVLLLLMRSALRSCVASKQHSLLSCSFTAAARSCVGSSPAATSLWL